MDSANETYTEQQIDCYYCGEPCSGKKYKDWTELSHEGQVIALHPLCNPNVLPDGRLRCAICKARPAKIHTVLCGSKKCRSQAVIGEHVQAWPGQKGYK